MIKKIISVFMAIILLVLLGGCNSLSLFKRSKPKKDYEATVTKKFESIGLEYKIPKSWRIFRDVTEYPNTRGAVVNDNNKDLYCYGEVTYGLISKNAVKNITITGKSLRFKLFEKLKILSLLSNILTLNSKMFKIVVLNKNNARNNSKNDYLDDDYDKCEKVGEKNNLEYYFLYNNEFKNKDLSKQELISLRKTIKKIKKSIKIITPLTLEEKSIKYPNNSLFSMNTKDFSGNKITGDVFKNNRLTVLYIWQTSSDKSADFNELFKSNIMQLNSLYRKFKGKQINIIGVPKDLDDGKIEYADKERLKKIKPKFINLMPDKILKNNLFEYVNSARFILFVDNKGRVIGKQLEELSIDQIEEEVNKILND